MNALRRAAAAAFVLVAVAGGSAVAVASSSSTARASWYGPGLYGNRMACGGRLSTSTIGVAHRWLPCGTPLTICYRGRCVAARVVDRGPFVPGREFDLTGGLAVRLGFSGVHSIRWYRR